MIFLLFAWLIVCPSPQTDIYHVIHVRGIILNQTKNDTLSVGDKLNPSDKLLFRTPKAMATVLSPAGGRFTLGLAAARQSSNGEEFMNLLKDVLMGETAVAKLSTRGLVTDKIVDLKGVFSSDSMVFLGGRSKLILDKSAHPMSHHQYFVYRYTYNEDKIAQKRIPHRADTLIFDKNILYTHNNHAIAPAGINEVEILKVNVKDQSSRLMGSFKPIFISDEELKTELEVIRNVMRSQQLTEEEIIEQMYYHILAVYGQTNENMLRLWLSEHLKM
ncbi:hypothetical protein GXP67_17840 [Rhodocytophaga rosea]|uniref:Uncharacterized protein n=1 Tax=Rhodocytophaga rosea TaxID=2704465 RepID=A0A6C0GK81_9BACT|nr:hypothetical protein [Rhodocytophaga rosea]QHT68369.1 hypothetical protein GXP67_17840 [Rhodocytophaga rosea]